MIFNKRKINHHLEIGQEANLTKAVKTSKPRAGFSPIKKVVSSLVVLSIATAGLIVGITSPTPGQETARADFAADLICGTNEYPTAIYGGDNSSLKEAVGMTQVGMAKDTSKPWGGFLSVPTPKGGENITAAQGTDELTIPITALERYGYFAPTFQAWTPIAVSEDADGNPASEGQIWYGSGGSSNNRVVGPGVILTDTAQTNMFASSLADCFNPGGATVANAIMLLPKFAIAIASTIYMAASDLSLTGDGIMAPVGDVIETIILGDGQNKGLKDLLFLDFMLVMVMLGALVIAWQGLKQGRATEAWQSIIWMIAVAITGILFLTNPLWIAGTMEKGIDIVTEQIESATLQANTMSPECALPNGEDKATERKVICSLWLNSIYKPWVKGQFGQDYTEIVAAANVEVPDPSLAGAGTAATTAEQNAEAVGWFTALSEAEGTRGQALSSSITNATIATTDSRGVFTKFAAQRPLGDRTVDEPAIMNWAFYHMHTQSNWGAANGVNASEVAYNQLALNGNTSWKTAADGVPNALLSMIASAAPTTFLIAIGGSLISFVIVLTILIVLAPFFLSLGFFPGWGRRILARWGELMASLFVKRIILALFLFVFLKIYISILGMSIDWTLQVLFITVLTIVALTQKNVISDMITKQINFGSGNAFGSEESMKAATAAGILGAYGLGRRGVGAMKMPRRQPKNQKNNAAAATPTQPQTAASTTTAPTTPTASAGGGGTRIGGGRTGGGNTSGGSANAPVPYTPPKGDEGPEGWKWDDRQYDEEGNLHFASRYNEDGTGKTYFGGETYTISIDDETASPYAIRDRDGRRIDPETYNQLTGKREQNKTHDEIDSKSREIESQEQGSAGYNKARAERAEARNNERSRVIEAQAKAEQKAITQGKTKASKDSPNTPTGTSKTAPTSESTKPSTNGPTRPNTRQGNKESSSEKKSTSYIYNPKTDTYEEL